VLPLSGSLRPIQLRVERVKSMGIADLAIKGVRHLPKAGPKIVVPLAIGAGGAIVAGTKGLLDVGTGRRVRSEATARLQSTLTQLGACEVETEQVAREYGEFQLDVHRQNLGRFADWLERNQAQVKRLNFKRIDGVRIKIPSIPKYVAGVHGITTGVTGVVSAVGVGAAAPAAALWGVSTFASASTGTAIASLSGAAATNATLAALGGGTLAMGGGGMAVGAAVLGLTAAVPAMLVGGFTLGVVGAKAKTKSSKYAAEVNLEVERAGLAVDMLRAVRQRIAELRDVLAQMAQRSTAALDELESVEFDADKHASEFLRAFQLVTAVKEILNTPVLDPKTGELSDASIEILRKFA